MRVLLVNGSPHPKGCTYTALAEVAKELEKQEIETEIFQIGKKPVSGCLGCGVCEKTGRCFIKDSVGMQIMRSLGINMAWLLKSIEAGKAAGIPLPAREDSIYTNFIR